MGSTCLVGLRPTGGFPYHGPTHASSSTVRIIVLYRGSIDNAEMADAVLNAAVDPQDLLQALQELLTGAPKKTG
jgi:hypothetical protein